MCISRKKNTYQDEVPVHRTPSRRAVVRPKPEDPPIHRPTPKNERLDVVPSPAPMTTPGALSPYEERPPPAERRAEVPREREEEKSRSMKFRSRRRKEDETLSNIPEEMPELEINRDKPEPFFNSEELI